jgi:hypothetical protein
VSNPGEEAEVIDRDWEAEASLLGWHPLEEFRGNPAEWIDARTFVVRGEAQLPLLRENNRRLTQRVRRSDDELADMRAKLDEVNDSLKTLRTMAERSNEAGYQRALADLKAQQRQAVRDGDEATFDKIEGEIAKVEATREEVTPKSEPVAKPDAPKGPKGTPEFQAWFAENKDWVQADQTLGRAAIQAETELRNADDDYTESEIWEKVTDMVQAKYPRRFAAATGTTPAAAAPSASGSTPRRAAGVLAPSGGASSSSTKKTGIDSIQDPDERKIARAAFQSIRRGIPDYTEAEYMSVYVNPGADTIAPAIKRKVGNGSRPN